MKRYTADEVAARLGTSAATVRRWARDGSIKGGQVGSQWRFPAEEVERLEAQANGEAA